MKREENHDHNPATEFDTRPAFQQRSKTSIRNWDTWNMLKVLSPQPQWCHTVPQPKNPKCPSCLDETGILGEILCCRATAARGLTAHGQPCKSNSRYLLPGSSCQGRDTAKPISSINRAKRC